MFKSKTDITKKLDFLPYYLIMRIKRISGSDSILLFIFFARGSVSMMEPKQPLSTQRRPPPERAEDS
jgi:hypothetical protein